MVSKQRREGITLGQFLKFYAATIFIFQVKMYIFIFFLLKNIAIILESMVFHKQKLIRPNLTPLIGATLGQCCVCSVVGTELSVYQFYQTKLYLSLNSH